MSHAPAPDRLPARVVEDSAWRAALHVLTNDPRIWAHVDLDDGRQITCHDGEHAAAVHILTDSLIWDAVGPFVRDRNGGINWTALEAEAPLHATGEQLLAAAALDLYGAHNDTFEPATLKRRCQVLEARRLARVLEAVCLLRPDAAPPGIGQSLGGRIRWQFGGGGGR